MIELRPYTSLGHADHGWLDARHHFSFASYRDPARMQWGTLRVWNDDIIAPQSGFPQHPHADMEIITYVREGAISHGDSLGNRGRTAAGDVQVMSAGTGITHTEYNAESQNTRLFQIWLLPDQRGGPPAWDTRPFPQADRSGRFVVLASGMAGDEDALPVRSNARVLGARLAAGESTEYRFDSPSRRGYLVPSRGAVQVNGIRVGTGDGAAITDESVIRVVATEEAELVMVDAAG